MQVGVCGGEVTVSVGSTVLPPYFRFVDCQFDQIDPRSEISNPYLISLGLSLMLMFFSWHRRSSKHTYLSFNIANFSDIFIACAKGVRAQPLAQ